MSVPVFCLPPGADFAGHFAAGLAARFGGDPMTLARTEVMVNTRRSQRAIELALADRQAGPAVLPRVTVLSELYDDPLAAPDLPPAVHGTRRLLRLTRLVERFLAAAAGQGMTHAPPAAAADLARALSGLLDELQEEGVDPAALDTVIRDSGLTDGAARHWQQTLDFVDIVRTAWPGILAEEEGAALDPKARQRAVIADLVAGWRDAPPSHPVIAAASTGSVGSTADLLAAIARLPCGMVVLPGFDPALEPEIWQAAGPDHPAAPFRGLLGRLELGPADIRPWVDLPDHPRRALMTQALRPAPVTDHWHGAVPALTRDIDAASEGMTLVETASPREEAEVIATAMRAALEVPGRTVALITPDGGLARRVTAVLDGLGIVPDDSLGRPLRDTPPGTLMRLMLEVAEAPSPVALAALLLHPLASPGVPRGAHLSMARRYVNRVLRREPEAGAALPEWETAGDDERAWLARIRAALEPLSERGDLAGRIACHRAAAEALTTPPDGLPQVWEATAGQAMHALCERLAAAADAYGAAPPSYPALFDSLMTGEEVRADAATPHPRIAILGTREARVAAADLTILGGLNDGVWPQLPGADPWLSRPMRAALGLPPPERTIGLAAHDFLLAAMRPEVILTRARKVDGAPTVAARWLIRLEHLMGGIAGGAALAAMRARGAALQRLAATLNRPDAPVARAPRPAPRPPVAARPRDLSATQVELLIRDAYAVYAGRILGLRPLDPLGRTPDFRDRGTVLHRVLERFTRDTLDWPGAEAAQIALNAAAETVLSEDVPWPDLRRLWRARIDRFAGRFIEDEAARRAGQTPVVVEGRGELELSLPGGPFRLIAKADRIDVTHAGEAAVYDYKTGTPPTLPAIKAGFYQQLHIQAAIALAGGYAGLPVSGLAGGSYIGLTGSAKGVEETEVPDLAETLDARLGRIGDLLAAYDREETGYLSRGRPEKETQQGDYDHLARRAEWEAEDGE